MTSRLIGLAFVFAPLSLATIGGGQAVVSDIQRQVVAVHHWLTATQFLDAFAISRMGPGPGSLLVTLIGWDVAGLAGAVVATIAIYAPTALLIYGVAFLWRRHQGARWQMALERGLRPVAAGMILATSFVLLRSLDGGWFVRGIAFASTGALMATRVSPLILLTIGAVTFVVGRAVWPG